MHKPHFRTNARQRRGFSRPQLEVLEDRLAPGGILDSPLLPDDLLGLEGTVASEQADTDGISTLAVPDSGGGNGPGPVPPRAFPGGPGGQIQVVVTAVTLDGYVFSTTFSIERLEMRYHLSSLEGGGSENGSAALGNKGGGGPCEIVLPDPFEGTSRFELVCGTVDLESPGPGGLGDHYGLPISRLGVYLDTFRGEMQPEGLPVWLEPDPVFTPPEGPAITLRLNAESARLLYNDAIGQWQITVTVLVDIPPVLIPQGMPRAVTTASTNLVPSSPTLTLTFDQVWFVPGDAEQPGRAFFGADARVDGKVQ